MPHLVDLLNSKAILYNLRADDKREILRAMADAAQAAYGIDASPIFEGVLTREALGGTGVGEGVAVPHARLENIDRAFGVFALLKSPVDFESPDGDGADLVFMLVSPENSGANHLKALAKITRLLRQSSVRSGLRAARSKEALLAILTETENKSVA